MRQAAQRGMAAAWWLLGAGAGLVLLEAAARYPAHPVVIVAALAVLAAGAWMVLDNPAWGACALIVIAYWNASNVVTETWGFSWVLRLAIAGTLAAAAWDGLLAPGPRRWRWPVLAPFLAYGAVQLLAALGAADTVDADLALYAYVTSLAAFYIVANLLRSPRAVRWGVNAVLVAVVLLSAPVIYQGVTGSANTFWGFGARLYKQIVPGQFGWRLGGAIGDPNFLAMMLVAALPLALMQALERGAGWRRRGFALGAAAAALAATVFTYSRGAFVGLGLIAVVFACKHPRRRWVVTGLAAALMVAAALRPQFLVQRLDSLVQLTRPQQTLLPDASFQVRRNALYAGALMFRDHPLLGVGPDNYIDSYLKYSALVGMASDPTQRDAHDLYIQIAAETGLAGLLTFGWLMWASFRLMERGRKHLRRLGAQNFAELIWALEIAIATYLVLSLFLHDAYLRNFLLLLALGTTAADVALAPGEAPTTAVAPSGSPTA
jgi:putative inorganic carbon (HCO3(-)) transporter